MTPRENKETLRGIIRHLQIDIDLCENPDEMAFQEMVGHLNNYFRENMGLTLHMEEIAHLTKTNRN